MSTGNKDNNTFDINYFINGQEGKRKGQWERRRVMKPWDVKYCSRSSWHHPVLSTGPGREWVPPKNLTSGRVTAHDKARVFVLPND